VNWLPRRGVTYYTLDVDLEVVVVDHFVDPDLDDRARLEILSIQIGDTIDVVGLP
jgi:hypothetical protein